MSIASRHLFGAIVAVLSGLLALSVPIGASVTSGTSTTFSGTFEFEGIAAASAGKGCRGEGAFGAMKRGARVTISERVASGDFETLGTGKIGRGKEIQIDGDDICRMPFKVKASAAPATDSRIYLEVKGVTFDIAWPAADVTDGDLGTWRCEYSDDTCAVVVGGG